MTPQVTICFVSFNTWSLTKLYIDSIVKFTKIPYRLLIADNGSIDGSEEELIKLQNTIHILTSKVCEQINYPEDKVALEIGYGGGRILNAACSYFKEVIGIVQCH